MTTKKIALDKFLNTQPQDIEESEKTIGQKAQDDFFSQKYNAFLNGSIKDEVVRPFSIILTKTQKDILDDATYTLRQSRKEIIIHALALYFKQHNIL